MVFEYNYKNLPLYAYNKHLATIVPSIFRKVNGIEYLRERLILKDNDFLDIDVVYNKNNKAVILSHGLEGNSEKSYIKGTAKLFLENGWDIIAWNCRSCSGEMNKAKRIYHHGEVEDIGEVVDWAVVKNQYKSIGLIGFSMGGVINTKYIATQKANLSDKLTFNIAVSTPCDLEACALTLDQKNNFIYKRKFFKSLKDKLMLKADQYPGMIDTDLLQRIKYWRDFDEHFSAGMNGFANRRAFYQQATLNNFLEDVTIPTLILNAANDPLIPIESNPSSIAKSNKMLQVEITKYGGHCGYSLRKDEYTYAERSALRFAEGSVG
ncbi:MAG TPA: alpha/beta fold hydrolase [Saprospiraceae bacterium]|nr:alpha/beta fold hydrolase [Saprospiraceae bacterium]